MFVDWEAFYSNLGLQVGVLPKASKLLPKIEDNLTPSKTIAFSKATSEAF